MISEVLSLFCSCDNNGHAADSPSAVQMYPEPNEQAKKLALFGVAGALANTIALASRIKPMITVH